MSQDPKTILCECFICKGENPEFDLPILSNEPDLDIEER